MADTGGGSEGVAAAAVARHAASKAAPAGKDVELLLNWLEAEVKDRLCMLDRKLDRLAGEVGTCPTPSPDLQAGRRQGSEVSLRPMTKVDGLGRTSPRHSHAPQFDSSAQGGFSVVLNREGSGRRLSDNPIDTLRHNLDIGCERAGHSQNGRLSQETRVSTQSSGPDLQERVWSIMHDQDVSPAARCYAVCMRYLVWVSVIVTLAQTVEPPPLSGLSAAVLETIFDSIFLLEIAIRLIVCPARWLFLCNVYNLIDLAAVVPLALRASIGFIVDEGGEEGGSSIRIVLLYVVPVVRILKNLRTFQKFHLLLSAFVLALEALPVLLFTLAVIVLSCSSLIYLLEPRSNIQSLPKAMYFTIITMTTVGYGDIHPSTVESHAAMCFIAVMGMLYMAMPIGIIGSAFTETWKDRDRILLVKRTRENLFQWGYTAYDIPMLFEVFDLDGDGDLSFSEFRKMMRRMRVGLGEDRILKLFRSIDTDGGGTIDAREFMRTCFPETFVELYELGEGTPRTTTAKLKNAFQAALRRQRRVRSPDIRERSRGTTSIGGCSEGAEAPPLSEEICASTPSASPDAEPAPSANAGAIRGI